MNIVEYLKKREQDMPIEKGPDNVTEEKVLHFLKGLDDDQFSALMLLNVMFAKAGEKHLALKLKEELIERKLRSEKVSGTVN